MGASVVAEDPGVRDDWFGVVAGAFEYSVLEGEGPGSVGCLFVEAAVSAFAGQRVAVDFDKQPAAVERRDLPRRKCLR